MDDLIPLLIIILISIVGAVSNNKKKKRMESGNIAESKLSNRDEDLLDWLDRLDINKEEQKESFEEPIPEMQPINMHKEMSWSKFDFIKSLCRSFFMVL